MLSPSSKYTRDFPALRQPYFYPHGMGYTPDKKSWKDMQKKLLFAKIMFCFNCIKSVIPSLTGCKVLRVRPAKKLEPKCAANFLALLNLLKGKV